ncbi:MAG: S24 family peptidase [Pseudomonadota bacterium]
MNRKLDTMAAQAANASTASAAELEAFVMELDHLDSDDIERINAQAGLAPGQPPAGLYRLDRIASGLDGARARWAQTPSNPAVAAAQPAWREVASGLDESSVFRQIRIFGFAMRGADITDGDWITVDTIATPVDGDIVLAEIAGIGMVVRRLRIIGGALVLKAAHPEFPSLAVDDPANIRFHGVVPEPVRKAR